MNEITKIHLGRQAFTVSVDAHHELKLYLNAIKQHVSDESVVDEVELRMAELLHERGINSDKVVLPADVDFLKEQLGAPADFAEDGGTEPVAEKPTDTKRLFRDTDNAMLAGVAAGLASYFGVDVLIVRLLFVVGTFTGGWGVLLYVVLWLLVPEAKTSSERLQMAGKPVTVDSLKEIVGRADVKGATERAHNSLAGPVHAAFSALLKIIGVCFVVIGLALLLSLIGGVTYSLLHGGAALKSSVFPVTAEDHLLVYIGVAVIAITALFIVLFGLAVYRRKWPVHAWITGTLVGLLFIGLAVGGALTADVVPQVRDRYNAGMHTTVRTLPAFSSIDTNEVRSDAAIIYHTADTYSVSLRYYGHPNLGPVKTTISHGVLTISTIGFDSHRHCPNSLCIPNDYELSITINAPNPPQDIGGSFDTVPAEPTEKPTLQVKQTKGSLLNQ